MLPLKRLDNSGTQPKRTKIKEIYQYWTRLLFGHINFQVSTNCHLQINDAGSGTKYESITINYPHQPL